MNKVKDLRISSWQAGPIIKKYMVFILLVLMLGLAEIFSPGYLAPTHLMGMIRLASFMGIAAIGQTFVILTGGIDLSIEHNISFAYIIAAEIMAGQDANVIPALGAVLLFGLIVGLINGAGIALFRVPPFIMTLGLGSVLFGTYMVYTNGAPKGSSAPVVSAISNENLFGIISGVVVVWLVLAVITIVLQKKTPFGRKIYSVGSNPIASNFSGINTKNVIFSVYVISAIVASLTGFLLIGYTGRSYLNAGSGYSTSLIAAVIIGGTSIMGGKGGYLGTIAGAAIMTVMEDFLTAIDIPHAGRMIAQGALILLLLLLYAREKEKKV
jgi:ribose transport system permease protein